MELPHANGGFLQVEGRGYGMPIHASQLDGMRMKLFQTEFIPPRPMHRTKVFFVVGLALSLPHLQAPRPGLHLPLSEV